MRVNTLHTGLLVASACWQQGRSPVHLIASAWEQSLEDVVHELNSVPVFGIRLVEEGTLYGTEPGGSIMYMQVSDAHRVLGQLTATFPGTELEVQSLTLGSALRQAGLLEDAGAGEEERPGLTLVASPIEVRVARSLGHDARTSPDPSATASGGVGGEQCRSGTRTLGVPVFDIGELLWDAEGEALAGDPQTLWPHLFCSADAEALWTEVGQDAPMPPLQAVDLCEVIERLKAHADGAAVRKPMLCAPLDSIEFMRSVDAQSRAASGQEAPDGASLGYADGRPPSGSRLRSAMP